MFNSQVHTIILTRLLVDLYKDPYLQSALGFKGGTAAVIFYNLPRFSVDLDFDLLNPAKKELVFERVKSVSEKFGTLTEAVEKRYTLFFLLSYEKGQRNIKVEISKRSNLAEYELKGYLGISMLVMKQDFMASSKLSRQN